MTQWGEKSLMRASSRNAGAPDRVLAAPVLCSVLNAKKLKGALVTELKAAQPGGVSAASPGDQPVFAAFALMRPNRAFRVVLVRVRIGL